MAKKRKYTFIDLFAGCGGLSEGFIQSGYYKPLAHVEWERPMVDTLRNRLVQKWGESVDDAKKSVVLFDIQKTEELLHGNWSEQSIEKYGKYNDSSIIKSGLQGLIGKQPVDLIIGGPPCQAYSIHGRAQDKNSMDNDYRNYLFECFVNVVNEFKPKMFVFENVAGILSAHPGGVKVTKRIYDAFRNVGYLILEPEKLPTALYNAVDFQVPQNRPRVIIIGVKDANKAQLKEFYSAISSEISNLPKRTVKDAIGNLPAIYPLPEPIRIGRNNISHQIVSNNMGITQHEPRYHAPREVNVFREWVINKMNYMSQKEKIDFYYKVTGHKTLYAKYKNLEWDKPSHTIVAHLSKDGYMFIHPDSMQARSITIREAALLMTFPMNYVFIGSNAMCYRMIGNAVPVKFAEKIANGINKVLK